MRQHETGDRLRRSSFAAPCPHHPPSLPGPRQRRGPGREGGRRGRASPPAPRKLAAAAAPPHRLSEGGGGVGDEGEAPPLNTGRKLFGRSLPPPFSPHPRQARNPPGPTLLPPAAGSRSASPGSSRGRSLPADSPPWLKSWGSPPDPKPRPSRPRRRGDPAAGYRSPAAALPGRAATRRGRPGGTHGAGGRRKPGRAPPCRPGGGPADREPPAASPSRRQRGGRGVASQLQRPPGCQTGAAKGRRRGRRKKKGAASPRPGFISPLPRIELLLAFLPHAPPPPPRQPERPRPPGGGTVRESCSGPVPAGETSRLGSARSPATGGRRHGGEESFTESLTGWRRGERGSAPGARGAPVPSLGRRWAQDPAGAWAAAGEEEGEGEEEVGARSRVRGCRRGCPWQCVAVARVTAAASGVRSRRACLCVEIHLAH